MLTGNNLIITRLVKFIPIIKLIELYVYVFALILKSPTYAAYIVNYP